MTAPNNFDDYVALLLPLYLRQPREALLKEAQSQRRAAARAWTSLRQANWLGEIAARAASVQDILEHLRKQGKRWADGNASPRLYKIIAQEISDPLTLLEMEIITVDEYKAITQNASDPLKHQVADAMKTAARQIAVVLKTPRPSEYVPDDAWVRHEQLALARLYIGTLVAWRRIDLVKEGQE